MRGLGLQDPVVHQRPSWQEYCQNDNPRAVFAHYNRQSPVAGDRSIARGYAEWSSLLHIVRKRMASRAPPANRHHMHMAPFIIDPDICPHHMLASWCTASGDGAAGVFTVRA